MATFHCIFFGYFLFLHAILSFLFFNLHLQRECIQRISSSSQYLINPEKLLSRPVLTVRNKNSIQKDDRMWYHCNLNKQTACESKMRGMQHKCCHFHTFLSATNYFRRALKFKKITKLYHCFITYTKEHHN